MTITAIPIFTAAPGWRDGVVRPSDASVREGTSVP
jgi:hypothetical protein